MQILETILVGQLITFVLVLTRVSGVVMTAPLFGAQGIPRRVRALLAVSLAFLITPLQPTTSASLVTNLLELGHLMALEALVGLLLGMGLNILFSGVQVAGQIISQMSGMSLADVFNPGFDEQVSVFSQLFFFLTLAVFVALGGHRMIIEALLQTYQWAPPGQAYLGDTFLDSLVSVVTQSFLLGIRAAAPVLTALLLSTIVLGLISRTMPQLNVILIGFNLNSMLTFAAIFLSLGSITWTFQENIVDVLDDLQQVIVSRT